jgi:hypothetical protein
MMFQACLKTRHNHSAFIRRKKREKERWTNFQNNHPPFETDASANVIRPFEHRLPLFSSFTGDHKKNNNIANTNA